MTGTVETDEKYWAEYDGLQNAKHQLLRQYLNRWFPIMASWSSRLLYIDCHAGRGRHETGHEGSPVLAVLLLLRHRQRARILASTEVNLVFFERNPSNYKLLVSELKNIGSLPQNVQLQPYCEDYEPTLREVCADLRSKDRQLAPSFAFLDPYGFRLSMVLLNDLLSFPHCELLINFMYHYVDMAMYNPRQGQNLDSLFGCPDWRDLRDIGDPDKRAREGIALFSEQLEADFVTHMNMIGTNNVLKYVLIHATNHRRGREVMKDAMWSVVPDGSFTAFERHDPNQLVLIQPEPDLAPLGDRLWARFAGETVRMHEIYEWLVAELYVKKHIHSVLRVYRDKEFVSFGGFEGRFSFDKNPLVTFPSQRPGGG